MRVIAYYPLHYGAEYLKESILSIRDKVEKIIFLYSPVPTYGHATHLTNPDSEELLRSIAEKYCHVYEWKVISAANEGEHRHIITQFNEVYDLTLAVDADEVWQPDTLRNALDAAYNMPYARYGIDGFLNFWKTFDQVCLDGFRPIRIYKKGQGEYINLKGTVYHFGYCISEELMRYKWGCHGHKSELRRKWIDDVYLSDRKNDLHPVAENLWNVQQFDKTTMPDFLKQHKRYEGL